MSQPCEKCGNEYAPMNLEKMGKGSKLLFSLEAVSYIVFGVYALGSYYLIESTLIWLCSLVAVLTLYVLFSKKDKHLCYSCQIENEGYK